MNKTTPLSIKLILLFFCMFSVGNTYSQNNQKTNKTLFGKPVKSGTINPNNGLIRCATTEYEEFLQENNPQRMSNAQFETWLNPLVAKYKVAKTNSKTVATIITIPVVVHVVHSGQAIGTAPNTTDEQIQSQITVLNQDFRRLLGTPGYNTNPIGADVEIEFVLAKQDPNGNPTNGIDRVNFTQASWSNTEIETILKPSTIWDPTLYLNMWSVKFTDNTVLGYAQFPDGSSLVGLNTSGGSANTDGVVSSYDVFGSSDFGTSFILVKPYDKGRTMTHEVGHWLGLRHIWGDVGSRKSGQNCSGSDYCDDTPTAGWENYDCLTIYDSCPTDAGNDMTENYMDYTNDQCMNIFTQNQKDRIKVIMNNAARRSSLKTSTKGVAIPLVAIDAEVKIATFNSGIDYGCSGTPPPPTNKQVSIYNRGTGTLTSVTLNYTINGGANQIFVWNGSLTPNQSVDVTLLNTNSNGLLKVSIATTNGGADQRVSNNTASRNYFDKAASNYNFTNYVFTLQQDFWGDEITWSLKDSSGAVQYSGGPYAAKPSQVLPLPALITQNWTLAANQCYIFTINDSESDGICCGNSGDGYYDIKSSDGSTTIASGASYDLVEYKYFSTNTLGTTQFEALNDIYLYPNPTKDALNIHVSSSFGLPDSYAISNSLGQIISRKVVSNEADLNVNTAALSTGIYFITVSKEDQSKTVQFIKE
jgi:hypothetical protein